MRSRASRKAAHVRSLILDSGFFDEAYYLSQGPCCGTSAPIDHYLEKGWREGFDPVPGFSILFYLSAYPDIASAGIDPLGHYVEHGRHEGRLTLPDDDEPSLPGGVPAPVAPTLADWSRLADRPGPRAEVDVVVPVYRGYSETLRCLYSALAAEQTTAFRVVVIYDHGPNTTLRRALGRLADLDLLDLIETPHNVGFVRSCNIGLAKHPTRDVVLLNSDTEMHGDWLDRLRRAAYSDHKVATVTPFSNNAEICSYPEFVTNNRAPLEIDDAALDRLAAEVNAGASVDIPTGVGFCLYVRRAALDAIGLLSEAHFGRGYGEENDLCRRAAAAGWRNLMAADVFVRHYGGRSFGADKSHLVEAAVRTVEMLHPGYNALIQHFIARDPVRPFREALDQARLAHRLAGRAVFLFVMHTRGGGTERHAQELADRLESEDTPVLFCRPRGPESEDLTITDPRTPGLVNLPRFNLRAGPAAFATMLARWNVVHLHIHQLVDFTGPAVEFFRQTSRLMGCDYDVTLHDYAYICPRITLVGQAGHYCGEPDLQTCERCVQTDQTSSHGAHGVWEWREQATRLLTDARKVFTPSRDTARRYARYIPEREFSVRPHFGAETSVRRRPRNMAQTRTLAIIGAIGHHKGSALIQACAELARWSAPALRFHVIGYTDRDQALRDLGNVAITGSYRNEALGDTLANSGACAAWFPAVWPETFSYTLSEALGAGLMPIAFDFGAIAERIREIGWGVVMPPALMLRPELLVEELLALELQPPPRSLSTGASYTDIARDYYELPARVSELERCAR